MTCKQGSAVLFPGTPAETRVTTTQRLDPDQEAQEVVETENTNLDHEELDRLRSKAQGVKYVSPREAIREERERPAKREREDKSAGQQIAEALKQIAKGGYEAPVAAESSGIGFLDPTHGAPLSRDVSIADGEIADADPTR